MCFVNSVKLILFLTNYFVLFRNLFTFALEKEFNY